MNWKWIAFVLCCILFYAGTMAVQIIEARSQSIGGGSFFSNGTTVSAPAVTSISPAQGLTSGGTSVVITGNNFQPVNGVQFGNLPASSFVVNNSHTITAVTPSTNTSGAVDTILNVGSVKSNADVFTFNSPAPPAPVITSILPTSGPVAGGTSVVLTGNNFNGATSCKFGTNVSSTCTVNSNQSITTSSPALAAGTYDITVTTGGGTSATSAADQFTEVQAAPTITNIAPNNGTAAGGTVITVTGTNFTGATAVTFCTTAAASFSVTNSTTMSVTSPALSAQSCEMFVTTPGGTNSNTGSTQGSDVFTFDVPAPAYTCTANRYVATNGLDTNSGLDAAHPWLTLGYAADTARGLSPGTCVNFASGTYTIGAYTPVIGGGNANTATGYIAYKSTVKWGAILKANAANAGGHMINIGGGAYCGVSCSTHGNPYIIIDGFEIDGDNEGLSSNPVTTHCLYSFNDHHIWILNNKIHDCGGAGVALNWSDFYTVYGNTVFNNAQFDTNQDSGIGIYEPWLDNTFTYNTNDTAATYHIIVAMNIAHDNIEAHVTGNHSDGNGIIIDDTRNTQNNSPWVPVNTLYTGGVLVEGNQAYTNGGSGVHLFDSTGITVTANTVWNDYTDTGNPALWRGSIDAQFGNNNTFLYNKAESTIGAGVLANNTAGLDNGPNTGETWTGNGTCETTTNLRSFTSDNVTSFSNTNPLGSCSLPN